MKTQSIRCSPVSHELVRGDVLDGVIEEVVHARSAVVRAEILADLVQEVYATVQWLHESDTALDHCRADELTSIGRLARAAQEHQRQMRAAERKVPV